MADLEQIDLFPAFELFDRLEPVILEHLAHAVAGAFGPAGDDRLAPCPRLGLDARNDRFKQVGICCLAFAAKLGARCPAQSMTGRFSSAGRKGESSEIS